MKNLTSLRLRKPAGVTILELLVTVGIIGVVASILTVLGVGLRACVATLGCIRCTRCVACVSWARDSSPEPVMMTLQGLLLIRRQEHISVYRHYGLRLSPFR